jgi:hypothetical protein
MNDRLSIIVIMGYVGQECLEPNVRDEIDCLGLLPEVKVPLEITIVDRAWPHRWGRIRQVLGDMLDRVRYVPVRPTEWVRRGMYSVSGAMNSGGICSSGSLLLMSGDHSFYSPRQMDMMYSAWHAENVLYAPVVDFSWGEHQLPEKVESVSGLNVGPRLLTRIMLQEINGWEEAFDGSRGRDDECIDLCLEVLLREKYDMVRLRHPKLIIHKVRHKNGHLPLKYEPPWTKPVTPDRVRLRCNLAFAQRVVYPRYEARLHRANNPLPQHVIDRIGKGCDITRLHHVQHVPPAMLLQANQHICCCNRKDREQQLETYTQFEAPDIAGLMDRFEEEFGKQYGCFDPWPVLVGQSSRIAHLTEDTRAAMGAPTQSKENPK